jgi:hypothetical protein
MQDDLYSPRPLAQWYWAGAVAALVFAVAACCLYVLHVTADPATLPLDERTVFAAEPSWVVSAFGVGAAASLIGSMLLLFRRKAAQPLMLVAVAAMIVWAAALVALPGLREVISANDIAVAIVVVAITWTIFWFARHSAQRGWLR